MPVTAFTANCVRVYATAAPVVEYRANSGTDHGWTIDFAASSAAVGQKLKAFYSSVSSGGATSYSLSRTITQNDLDGTQFNFTEVSGSLTPRTYYVQLAYYNASDVRISDFTNVTVTFQAAGDVTAPVLTSATGTKTGTSTATVGATTDTAEGTMYVCATTTSTTPTHDQIAAGTNHAGAAAAAFDSVAVSSTGAKTIALTGLTPGTTYYGHTTHVDASGNKSTPVTSASFTTDSATATLSSASAAAAASPNGEDTLVATFTTNTGSGTAYTVASTSSTAPTGAQIEAGQMHTGAAAAGSASNVISSTGVKTASISGLTNSTRYWLHTVQKTGSNYSNVVTADAYTDVTDTYVTTQSTTGTASISTTNINFANVAVGNAHPNKVLLVLAGHNGGSAQHSSFVATGLTPVKLVNFSTDDDTANANCISVWAIPCPNGGTISGLQLQLSAAPTRGAASFYVTDRGTTATEIIKQFSVSASGMTDDIHVPPYGAAFGIATTTSDLSTVTWTGLTTEDYDAEPAAGTWSFSTARYINPSSSDLLNRAVTTTYLTNPSANLRFAVVSFGDHT